MMRQLPMTRPCLCVTAALLLLAATLGAPALLGQTPVPSGLQRAEPMVCNGNDDLVVRGRFIETAGNGIEVSGDCDVEVVGSHIVAGGVGILVVGDGDAIVKDSHVEGRRAALLAGGDGEIRYYRTSLRGGVRTEGHGEIAGDDGTVREGSGGSASDLGGLLGGTTVKIDAGGVAVRDGSETISIRPDGVGIDGGGDAVSVTPTAYGVAVDTEDASVVVDGDAVRLRTDDTATEVSARWRAAGASAYRASDTDRLLAELGAVKEDGGLRLGLAGDVLFGFDSAAIRPDATAMLAKVAHVLRQRAGAGEIQVLGHTDSIGGAEYNRKLSEARALAVMRWLHAEEGVPVQLMVGRGMGAAQPVAHNTRPDGSDDPEGRARNRRVEIFFATSR